MEENQRLRMYLDRAMKDYRALQMQFNDMVQQEPNKSSSTITTHQETEEPELVSLSLGMSSSDGKKDDHFSSKNHGKEKVDKDGEDDKKVLALGLDCNFELPKDQENEPSPNPSLEASSGEVKEEEGGEKWPPQKSLKNVRSEEDEVSQQNPAKRARVSVRVRCDTPTVRVDHSCILVGDINVTKKCLQGFFLCFFVNPDERWMSVEEIWTEDRKRESMSSSILSLHCCTQLPCEKAGRIYVCLDVECLK